MRQSGAVDIELGGAGHGLSNQACNIPHAFHQICRVLLQDFLKLRYLPDPPPSEKHPKHLSELTPATLCYLLPVVAANMP